MDERLSDRDFAAAVRELTKAETNEEALEIVRDADETLSEMTSTLEELDEPAAEANARMVDPSRLPE